MYKSISNLIDKLIYKIMNKYINNLDIICKVSLKLKIKVSNY